MKPKTKMKNSMLLILILIFILISVRCDTTEPPLPKASLTLTLEDVSCTEAWIMLKPNNLNLPATVTLYKNSVAQNNILCYGDTLLYIDSLLPKQTYLYQASGIRHQASAILSNELSVTTLDTTSHNFTWQTFTFGEHSSSVLYDVAIINENNIWAVGEIYMKDSLGRPDPKRYNAVIWNGNNWNVIRIPYNYQGSDFYHPIQSVYAFGANDIWFCGNGVIHWDGNNFLPIPIPSNVWGAYQINKLWGRSSNDLYAVGNGGNIAHYSNGSWRKIESGTTLPIMDIYGAKEGHSGNYEILCVSADPNIPAYSQILAIHGGNVRAMATNPMWEPWGIWYIPNRLYMTAGDGLWQARTLSGPWVRNNSLPSLFKTSIRGQSLIDIVVGGAFWLLAHWNGMTWQTYFPRTSGSFISVSLKGNLIIAVGGIERKAVLVIGRR